MLHPLRAFESPPNPIRYRMYASNSASAAQCEMVSSTSAFAPEDANWLTTSGRSPFPSKSTHCMDAQMSQYPPPPTPDHQHYTPVYPAAAAAAAAANAQLLSPAQAEQLQYSPPVDPSAYAKIEPGLGAPNSHLNHAHQPEEQSVQPPPPAVEGQQKTNRLRKACDSCSIRKVKVSMAAAHLLTEALLVVWCYNPGQGAF